MNDKHLAWMKDEKRIVLIELLLIEFEGAIRIPVKIIAKKFFNMSELSFLKKLKNEELQFLSIHDIFNEMISIRCIADFLLKIREVEIGGVNE
ncbi:hypothetical protein [Aliiglaciecola sp. NS0011-25]|uniref:hypothetical protein n=1 Tax=Aliiglaciecola sp. NS0011-25 TaxID=3127654 RepID=UPI00310BFA18